MTHEQLRQLRDYFSHDVWLLDVFGHTAKSPDFHFVTCALEFPFTKRTSLPFSSDFVASCPVSHWLSDDGWEIDVDQPHVIWLRGRIAHLFGVNVPFAQESSDVSQVAFVAVTARQDLIQIHPFLLIGGGIGDYGEFETDFKITFPSSVDAQARKMIATQFTTLLTANNDLTEFSDFMSDGIVVYRIRLNSTLASITSLGGANEENPDDHAGFGYFPDRECLDCNGTGEEYIKYPIRQTCETCNGTGRVHW